MVINGVIAVLILANLGASLWLWDSVKDCTRRMALSRLAARRIAIRATDPDVKEIAESIEEMLIP